MDCLDWIFYLIKQNKRFFFLISRPCEQILYMYLNLDVNFLFVMQNSVADIIFRSICCHLFSLFNHVMAFLVIVFHNWVKTLNFRLNGNKEEFQILFEFNSFLNSRQNILSCILVWIIFKVQLSWLQGLVILFTSECLDA